ncbi:uncharacterized protein ACNS7B_005979 [Menidia menidia]
MKLESKMLLFLTLVVSVPTVMPTTPANQEHYPPTTGGPGVNLKGKMFTLSRDDGGISFYSPYSPPPWWSSTPRYSSSYYYKTTPKTTPNTTPATTPKTTPATTPKTTPATTPKTTPTTTPTTTPKTTPKTTPTTTPRTTPRTTHFPWTTAPPTRGVSVCLRYITDGLASSSALFNLSPSRGNPLSFGRSTPFSYYVTDNIYNKVYLQPNIRWMDFRGSMWTSVCLIVDTARGVVQLYKDSSMSIRKLLPYRYLWSGEPRIDFRGFDGQLTDVQVWDYPLSYKEIFYFMSDGRYGWYRGSVLTWSNIIYSVSGRTLLEDVYEQPGGGGGRRGHRLRGGRHRGLIGQGESKQGGGAGRNHPL